MKGRIEIKTLFPLTKLPMFGEVPKLFKGTVNTEFKKQLTYDKKLALISETLFGDNSKAPNYVQSWPASYRIWVACLLHYVLNKGNSKTLKKREILAISCSIFLFVFKNLLVNPSEQKSKASSTAKNDNPNLTLFQQAIKESTEKLKSVRSFYQKFENFSEVTGKKFIKSYDMRISYGLSEYLCSVFSYGNVEWANRQDLQVTKGSMHNK
ncbi:unnamed protein product [Orchesella dallaii]|uniref:Uncharacterized protein n=1 Tax=Orchesella dallaii TaxID=48710 RepID=A0ABP1R7Z7_9HEXA